MILTAEVDWDGKEPPTELAICFDGEGLDYLIRELEKLHPNEKDHTHLLTPSWGGWGLTEEKHASGAENHLMNHLRIVRIPDLQEPS